MRQLAKEVRTELEEKNKKQLQEMTQQLEELQAAEADQQANYALESEEAAYFNHLDEQQENPDVLPEVITEMKEELQARKVIPRQEQRLWKYLMRRYMLMQMKYRKK